MEKWFLGGAIELRAAAGVGTGRSCTGGQLRQPDGRRGSWGVSAGSALGIGRGRYGAVCRPGHSSRKQASPGSPLPEPASPGAKRRGCAGRGKAVGPIRKEIEAIEGRLRYLRNQVGYSTLRITFYELDVHQMSFWTCSGRALGAGWGIFLTFLVGVLRLWPFWLLLAALGCCFADGYAAEDCKNNLHFRKLFIEDSSKITETQN